MVIGTLENLLSMSSAAAKREFLINSELILPCAAIFRSSPRLMPAYFSIACKSIGAFSDIDRSSSPCRRPLAMACVSWSMALFCSSALAPAITNDLFISSINRIDSSLFLNTPFVSMFSLAIDDAIVVYSARVLCAVLYIFSLS